MLCDYCCKEISMHHYATITDNQHYEYCSWKCEQAHLNDLIVSNQHQTDDYDAAAHIAEEKESLSDILHTTSPWIGFSGDLVEQRRRATSYKRPDEVIDSCVEWSENVLNLAGCDISEHTVLSDKSTEKDPNGLDSHAPGAKLDAGKSRPGLVLSDFVNALQEVVHNGTFGANKYSDSGWLSVKNGKERYMDAALRHLIKHWSGEKRDAESGTLHLAAVAWNMLACAELELRKENKGD